MAGITPQPSIEHFAFVGGVRFEACHLEVSHSFEEEANRPKNDRYNI